MAAPGAKPNELGSRTSIHPDHSGNEDIMHGDEKIFERKRFLQNRAGLRNDVWNFIARQLAHNDECCLWKPPAQFEQKRVVHRTRYPQCEQNHFRFTVIRAIKAFAHGSGCRRCVTSAGENFFDDFADGDFVIDDENRAAATIARQCFA